SGVYIDFLYGLLELKAGLMETEFRGSLNRLVRAASGVSEDTRITQTWTRNKPRNDLEIAQIINGTSPDVMSNQTKTKVHPLVDDWVDERKQIDKEAESLYPEQPLFKEEVDDEEE
ncbi:MAG TPA: phage portal protein, partial [Dielma fastidiosa]|nr:phage portal protein [Dielma fastidiosa]